MTETKTVVSVNEYVRQETKKNIVLNVILNAGIAYATFHSVAKINPWGEQSYGNDLMLTGFVLCAILGSLFIVITRRKQRAGQLMAVGHEGLNLARFVPYNPWLAGIWLGILGLVLAVPALIGILTLLGVSSLSPVTYAIVKGLWAGILAAIVVPVAIGQGLRLPSTPTQES